MTDISVTCDEQGRPCCPACGNHRLTMFYWAELGQEFDSETGE
jgi:hypothetical protein